MFNIKQKIKQNCYLPCKISGFCLERLCSSGTLRAIGWKLITKVSGHIYQNVGHTKIASEHCLMCFS